jgi:hypothetical protein
MKEYRPKKMKIDWTREKNYKADTHVEFISKNDTGFKIYQKDDNSFWYGELKRSLLEIPPVTLFGSIKLTKKEVKILEELEES